ncbi:3-oxoacyl-ACP reductase FabG [Ornithinimicrobium cryptoxanthini]|uniref:3-oxoacyl-ACP reductase FabG n=1 Tax=Ornithinimicrobium cryptoxanthini TaxID=2934161 RepID=UPI0021186F22|nr:3-oxoacyl-ACP reductase FabG [Ornithinimicrobium cryptoxanthini]
MTELLAGKVAVITGSARGIGRTIARTFAAHGAATVISDIDEAAATVAADDLAADGHRVIAVPCDVRDEHAVESLAQRAADQFGGLDIWVNNAGITRDATMLKMELEDFRLVVDVHMTGCWLGTRAAARHMKPQGSGSIINMSSLSAKVGTIGQTNYSGAKAGIIGITKAAARELARSGVRVNAIQPGLIATAMTEQMPADVLAQRVAEIPMQRIGQPDDIAGVAVYLASDLASYVTGTVAEVAGGRHM